MPVSKKSLGLEFKVGAFTLVGILATGYLFFAINPDMFSDKKNKTYQTRIKNAAGIVAKSHVKTNGVSVGKIVSVELDANDTKVTFEVDANVPIPKGSTVSIKSVGFLGDSHLAVLRVPDSGDYIEDGGFIAEAENKTDLNGLIEVAGGVATDIKKITANLADSLGTDEGKKKIEDIVDSIRDATVAAKGILVDNRDDIRKFVSNLSEVLNDDNRDRIDRIIASFDASMEEVKSATKNINLISARVENGEGTLGQLINNDEALEELKGAIKDVREILAPATKLEIEVASHVEARKDQSSQAYFNLVFKTKPDRFYLLGFTDLAVEEEERTFVDASSEIPEGEKYDRRERILTKTKKAMRFNVQFGKRWGPLAMRFGLFESTGGVGSDLYLVSDKLRFTVEAFDWQGKRNLVRRVAHLKTYASILFFNHIYVLAGIDDPLKYKKRGDASTLQTSNWFMGAGITFNDEDLKAIFGTAALAL